MSSALPWFAVSQDGVENDDELSHAGGESLFAGFPGGAEFVVMRGDDRVLPAGNQGRHVEGAAHGRTPAGDGAAAAQGAAVAVDRSDADQRGDFAAGGAGPLRQLRAPREPGWPGPAPGA